MRYIGSKEKIASDIVGMIQSYIMLNNIETYIEPFVGGLNIIDKVICTNKYGYDNNKLLVELINSIKNGKELPDKISLEQYIDYKAHYKNGDKYYEDYKIAAVGYLTSVSGEIYDDKYITLENKDGLYESNKEQLLNQIEKIRDTEIMYSDYLNIDASGCLIYCDPPSSNRKLRSTLEKRFDTSRFWSKAREWSKNNIVLISSTEAPDDFDVIWEQDNYSSNTSDKLFIHHSLNINKVSYNF